MRRDLSPIRSRAALVPTATRLVWPARSHGPALFCPNGRWCSTSPTSRCPSRPCGELYCWCWRARPTSSTPGRGAFAHRVCRCRCPRSSLLTYHARVPYRRRAPLHRRAVFARDAYRCQYCGRRAECIDHVHPRSRGGEHTWENVVACCRSCNVGKGDSLLSEGRYRLRRTPYAPEPLAVVAAMRGDAPTEWTDYLPRIASSARLRDPSDQPRARSRVTNVAGDLPSWTGGRVDTREMAGERRTAARAPNAAGPP